MQRITNLRGIDKKIIGLPTDTAYGTVGLREPHSYTCRPMCDLPPPFLLAIIDSSYASDAFMLKTYYSKCIAWQLYAQKCLKFKKINNGLRQFSTIANSLAQSRTG